MAERQSAATVQPRDPDSDLESVASLPESESSSDLESADDEDDAEREWRESLKQLELILTMVLIPYLGKYFGRKAAYWSFSKFLRWKYPVDVVVTSPAIFKGAGALGAAVNL